MNLERVIHNTYEMTHSLGPLAAIPAQQTAEPIPEVVERQLITEQQYIMLVIQKANQDDDPKFYETSVAQIDRVKSLGYRVMGWVDSKGEIGFMAQPKDPIGFYRP